MYGTPGNNRRQLEKLVDKIREKKEDLQRQQRDLKAMLRGTDGGGKQMPRGTRHAQNVT